MDRLATKYFNLLAVIYHQPNRFLHQHCDHFCMSCIISPIPNKTPVFFQSQIAKGKKRMKIIIILCHEQNIFCKTSLPLQYLWWPKFFNP
jgi:hypothetical protein